MPPFNSALFDAALQIAGIGGTQTATLNSSNYDLAQGASMPIFKWDPDGGGTIMYVVIPITSYKTSAENESYSFSLQDSPDNGADVPTGVWTTWSRVAVLGLGATETPPQPGFILLPWAARNPWVRVNLTIAGTAPTITIGTPYISPKVNALRG